MTPPARPEPAEDVPDDPEHDEEREQGPEAERDPGDPAAAAARADVSGKRPERGEDLHPRVVEPLAEPPLPERGDDGAPDDARGLEVCEAALEPSADLDADRAVLDRHRDDPRVGR